MDNRRPGSVVQEHLLWTSRVRETEVVMSLAAAAAAAEEKPGIFLFSARPTSAGKAIASSLVRNWCVPAGVKLSAAEVVKMRAGLARRRAWVAKNAEEEKNAGGANVSQATFSGNWNAGAWAQSRTASSRRSFGRHQPWGSVSVVVNVAAATFFEEGKHAWNGIGSPAGPGHQLAVTEAGASDGAAGCHLAAAAPQAEVTAKAPCPSLPVRCAVRCRYL